MSAAESSHPTPSRSTQDTALAELVGEGDLDVHSYHHQGLDRLGDGLVVTARTDDGLAQAFESTGDGYVMGVQWHPEQDLEDRRLFAGLVHAASERAVSRYGASRLSGGVVVSGFTLINPATAAPIREVSRASVGEVDAAIARAVKAQRSWAALAPAARADGLRAFARVVEAHVEELALLEVLNSGHPISSARWEASHVAQVLNYYAGAPERLAGQQIPVAGGIDITFHEPYGVVGIIVPWNFPMTIAAWGFAPALAAGNAVVLKPAELTPLTAMRLGELALEAGLPEGLFEVITGSGSVVGQRFVSHPDVRKVVFTGSTEVGTDVAAGCARALKPRHPRARRQERERDLRGCRSRTRRRVGARRGVRQRGPGLLRAQPHPRAALGVRPLPRAARTRRRRLEGRRPARRSHRDGPAHLGGASRHA